MINYKKRTNILLLASLLLMTSGPLQAQNSQIDSLKKLVQTSKNDTAKVATLNELSLAVLSNEDIPEALAYAERANKLAKQLNFIEGQALAQKYIGLAQYYQGNYLAVMDYWSQSLESFEVVKDTVGMANILNNLGGVYLSQGSNAKALDYYLQSLYYAEKIKDTLRVTSVLPNIGAVYGDMKDYNKALEYFNQIEQYLPSLKDPQITTYYLMGIGEIYNKMKNYDMALESYHRALPLNKNKADYSHILKELGTVEFMKGNIEKAISHLNLAYQTAKEKNQQLETLNALIELANVYQNSNFAMALGMYHEAELLANEMKSNKALRDIYKGLSKTYETQRDFSNAFKYQTLYLAQKDSLFNLETDDKIRGLQFDFDLDKKEDEIGLLEQEAQINELKAKRQKSVIYGTVIALGLVFLLALGVIKRYRYVKKTNRIIEEEKTRSENLLLNILPAETALELKQFGKVKAKKFESVTVMFTDFKGFTSYSNNLSPEMLVNTVDYYFSKFDAIIEKYDLEKIKTIGDAYMVAGGLPFPTKDHPKRMVQAAFEIAQVMEDAKNSSDDIESFEVRIGINTGAIVAGVVGTKKFAYDIWGDTVNVAARMESLSEPGKINVSESTYKLVRDAYDCEHRGEIHVKNKGMMDMYFIHALKEPKASKPLEKKKVNI